MKQIYSSRVGSFYLSVYITRLDQFIIDVCQRYKVRKMRVDGFCIEIFIILYFFRRLNRLIYNNYIEHYGVFTTSHSIISQ